jgi:formamidopyrimidine-DNA glycosylase
VPELPEVETIRSDLSNKIVGKKITKVLVYRKNMIEGGTAADFTRKVLGEKIVLIDRIGKLLIFDLKTKDKFLLMHMKMTGQLVYCDNRECLPGGHSYPEIDKLPNKHTHIIYEFDDGSKLYFNDQRTFGYAKVVNRVDLKVVLSKFGIEPLTNDFTREKLKKIFSGRKKNIKAVLMDQNLIAGIGNIYADEILWDAKIRPSKQAGRLNNKEIIRLYNSSNKIIKKAIKWRGTTFSDYRDVSGRKGNFVKYLNAYEQEDKVCKRCRKSKIKKVKFAGRGTRYCPWCQK